MMSLWLSGPPGTPLWLKLVAAVRGGNQQKWPFLSFVRELLAQILGEYRTFHPSAAQGLLLVSILDLLPVLFSP